jgi:predicted RNA-binding Zn ribbon-like protein
MVSMEVNQQNSYARVVKLSQKYAVPPELARLYDFLNTLDQRRYVENGTPHTGADQIATPRLLESWMLEHGLLHRGQRINARDHSAALELRQTLRDFLLIPPPQRPQAHDAAHHLTTASRKFPLTLSVSDQGVIELVPIPGSSPLGHVLAEVIGLAQTNQLARLKTCASDECHWIFFDRSKPANRHWCSSTVCGNRQKTRAYRLRQRDAS